MRENIKSRLRLIVSPIVGAAVVFGASSALLGLSIGAALLEEKLINSAKHSQMPLDQQPFDTNGNGRLEYKEGEAYNIWYLKEHPSTVPGRYRGYSNK